MLPIKYYIKKEKRYLLTAIIHRNFIASTFNTTSDYLYGLTDDPNPSTITISSSEDPELFSFVNSLQNDKSLEKRLLEYFNKLTQQDK